MMLHLPRKKHFLFAGTRAFALLEIDAIEKDFVEWLSVQMFHSSKEAFGPSFAKRHAMGDARFFRTQSFQRRMHLLHVSKLGLVVFGSDIETDSFIFKKLNWLLKDDIGIDHDVITEGKNAMRLQFQQLLELPARSLFGFEFLGNRFK